MATQGSFQCISQDPPSSRVPSCFPAGATRRVARLPGGAKFGPQRSPLPGIMVLQWLRQVMTITLTAMALLVSCGRDKVAADIAAEAGPSSEVDGAVLSDVGSGTTLDADAGPGVDAGEELLSQPDEVAGCLCPSLPCDGPAECPQPQPFGGGVCEVLAPHQFTACGDTPVAVSSAQHCGERVVLLFNYHTTCHPCQSYLEPLAQLHLLVYRRCREAARQNRHYIFWLMAIRPPSFRAYRKWN